MRRTSQDIYVKRSRVLFVTVLLNSTVMIRVWPVGALWTNLPLLALMVVTVIQSYVAHRRTMRRIEREMEQSRARLMDLLLARTLRRDE